MEVTIFVHKTLEDCIGAGDHLQTVDMDGYCNGCGNDDDRPEQGDYGPEPAPVDFYLNDAEPKFGLRSVLDSDQERAVELRAWKEGEAGCQRLLIDREDVVNMFLFSYTWLRAGGGQLPLLKLWNNISNPQSIDIQAPGAPTIAIQFDPERNLYAVLKLVGDGAWKEMTSVSASPASRPEGAGLSCPFCQGGPIFPDVRGPASYECNHCGEFFILPSKPHEQGPRTPAVEGVVPGEVLAIPVPPESGALYSNDGGGERLERTIIAIGRSIDLDAHTQRFGALVFNKKGYLVYADSLPGFLGIHPEDE